jgi:hypothetical protein
LIDIPSTFQLERLQQQEAEIRSNEYISALNTVKLPEQTLRKLSSMTSVNVKGSGVDLPGLNEVLEQAVRMKGPIDTNGNGLGAPRERTSTSSGSSMKAPSVREVLAEKTVDPKTVGWVRLGPLLLLSPLAASYFEFLLRIHYRFIYANQSLCPFDSFSFQ